MPRAGASIAIACVLAACEPAGGTLVVQVRTDLAPGIELASVRVEIATMPLPTTVDTPAAAARDWGRGVRVAELPLARGTYSFRVAAIGPDRATVVQRRVRAEVGGGVRVATVLLTRDCAGVTCPGAGDDADATECAGGRCVLISCIEENTLSCGDAECGSSAECGPPAEACLLAECTASGTCFAAPDHARCARGEVCVVGDGCVRADVTDGGALDAGQGDAGLGDGGLGDAGGLDASSLDAGAPDAGGAADAGPPDDAGGPSDAGPPDAGPDGGPCDVPCGLVPQCGCMAGQSCTYLPGTGPTCTPSGPGARGDPCSEHLDCAAGLDCLYERGRCLPYCREGTDCIGVERCAHLGVGVPAGICLGDLCDPLVGGGACLVGETCRFATVLDSMDTPYRQTFCSPHGTVGRSRACTYANDCAAGLDCFAGSCRPYCRDSSDCGSPDAFCVPPDAPPLPPPGVCTDACDLLAGTGCGAGRTCRFSYSVDFDGTTMLSVKLCDDAGPGAEGAACSSGLECARGLHCVGSACRQLCDRAAPSCARGSCTPLAGDPTVAGVVYGACL